MSRTTCVLVLSSLVPLAAQDLASIERTADAKLHSARQRVLAEKYEALRAYVDREIDPQPADLTEALVAAADLAGRFGTAEAQQGYAQRALALAKEGRIAQRARLELGDAQARLGAKTEELQGTYEPLLASASLEDGSIDAAFSAAVRWSGLLAERSQLEQARGVWTRLADKLGHPQIAEIAAMQGKLLERVGGEPPPIEAKDLAGTERKLADWRGKVVLIDFWATWCGPCIQELPNVVAAYQQFHEQGFEVLGISLDRERERLDQFLARQNMPWPQIHDTPEAGAIANKYGVESIPATFLLGRDGKIARVGLRGEDLHDAVQLLLERKQ